MMLPCISKASVSTIQRFVRQFMVVGIFGIAYTLRVAKHRGEMGFAVQPANKFEHLNAMFRVAEP